MSEPVKVRLKNDPSRSGLWLGEQQGEGNREKWRIHTNGRTEWWPKREIAILKSEPDNPRDLLRAGKFSPPAHLRRVLSHVRLSGRLIDYVYSMDATLTEFHAHQFKPVLKILHPSSRQGLLIADEVGLGKTIEAGLIWTELRARFDFRRLLILCPAALRDKWRDELTSKMGLTPAFADAEETLRHLEDTSGRGFTLICSQQGLRPSKGWETGGGSDSRTHLARHLNDNQEEPIDLLVVDEAHHLRNTESATHDIGRLLRKAAKYAVLLTATPLHNQNRDLLNLLRLVDEDLFDNDTAFHSILEANRPLTDLREELMQKSATAEGFRKKINSAKKHHLLTGNRQLEVLARMELSNENLARPEVRSELAERIEKINLMGSVLNRTRKRDVEKRAARIVNDELLPMTVAERKFYDTVTLFVRKKCREKEAPPFFFLAMPQRQMASCMAAALSAWRTKADMQYEGIDDAEQNGNSVSLAGQVYRDNQDFFDSLENEIVSNDSKYRRLADTLVGEELRREKVIIFSFFRNTLDYLHSRLSADGYGTAMLCGGLSTAEKTEVVRQFRERPDVRILLSSEVGGEGIDLQFSRMLINYDLPWNPMTLEQRIGRIDRFGQQSDRVCVWNILYEKTIDEYMYTLLYKKLELFEQALGGTESVIAGEFMLFAREILTMEWTPEQRKQRAEQLTLALANRRRDERKLEKEAAHLIGLGDYILRQVNLAHDRRHWIGGDDLFVYVKDFLTENYPGCELIRAAAADASCELRLNAQAQFDFERFLKDQDKAYSGRLANSSALMPVRFESKVAAQFSGRTEIINQFHPLIRFVYRKREEKQFPYPAAAIKLSVKDSPIAAGIYLIAASLWHFRADQTIEKIAYRGRRLAGENIAEDKAEDIIAAAVENGGYWREWRDSIALDELSQIGVALFGELSDRCGEFTGELRNQAEDRADAQVKSSQRREQKEEARIRATIDAQRAKGNLKMIPALEGQIRSLKQKMEARRDRIQAAVAGITHRSDEVFIALVLIE